MGELQLPIESFPGWALLQDVEFNGVGIAQTPHKGYGLVSTKDSEQDTIVLRVPRDLLLSVDQVEQYAKVDSNFKDLLEAFEQLSPRMHVLLFLFSQLVSLKAKQIGAKHCTSTPWMEYIQFIPHDIPVPTMWEEAEQMLLNGTSLDDALGAKLAALHAEFDTLRDKSSELPFWNSLLWDSDTVSFSDWVVVDAWFRSRCLELPLAGTSMVPALDMVNHAHQATAYYQEDDQDGVMLRIRPNRRVQDGEEVTISYGEAKPPAEMLFSYGFIDTETTIRELTLQLDPLEDDPLGRAKLHIFNRTPTVKLTVTEDGCRWESPFAFLMCLNEEDGLDFRLLQDHSGVRELRLFWQEEDVSDRTDDFEALVRDHELREVFHLRVTTVLHERVEAQLQKIITGPNQDELEPLIASDILRRGCVEATSLLKRVERETLAAAVNALDAQKTDLLADEHVVAYLGLMEASQNEQAPSEADGSTNEDDFS